MITRIRAYLTRRATRAAREARGAQEAEIAEYACNEEEG